MKQGKLGVTRIDASAFYGRGASEVPVATAIRVEMEGASPLPVSWRRSF